MRRFRWKTLLCCTLLLPLAAAADDADDAEPDGSDATHVETVRSLAELESRWRLSHPVVAPTYAGQWPQASTMFDFDVQSENSFMRVARIRSLSFLTLSGNERSKWFLGINEDGLVGIHFRGFTRNGARRHLDVASLFSDDQEGADAY